MWEVLEVHNKLMFLTKLENSREDMQLLTSGSINPTPFGKEIMRGGASFAPPSLSSWFGEEPYQL